MTYKTRDYCTATRKHKIVYCSRAKAERARIKAANLNHGLRLYPYRCRHCGGWHLSGMPSR